MGMCNCTPCRTVLAENVSVVSCGKLERSLLMSGGGWAVREFIPGELPRAERAGTEAKEPA